MPYSRRRTAATCLDFVSDLAFLTFPMQKGLSAAAFTERYVAAAKTRQRILREISFLSFGEIVSYFMEHTDTSLLALAIDADLDERTLRRIRSGKNSPSKRSAIAICLALGLPSEFSRIALAQCGFQFTAGSPEDDALLFVLTAFAGSTVRSANRFLTDLDFDPLTQPKQ